MAPSDDQLMDLAQAGDRAAFDEIVRRHQGLALAVAFRLLDDESLARDACQRAFVELLRLLPSYEPRGRLRASTTGKKRPGPRRPRPFSA